MHPDNPFKNGYDIVALTESCPYLRPFVITTPDDRLSIDFGNYEAVYKLNKALLHYHFGLKNWTIPDDYLCPPIPSRLDYLLYLKDVLPPNSSSHILDIGTGANLIYALLGTVALDWNVTATEKDETSYDYAIKNKMAMINDHPAISNITVMQQTDPGSILKNIIKPQDYFDATICNPPFYESESDAAKKNHVKNKALDTNLKRNFGGQSHELWCNGGEALFIKRLIKESVLFKNQVGLFTCLVSQSGNLKTLEKQLIKAKANFTITSMKSGHKLSRFMAWSF